MMHSLCVEKVSFAYDKTKVLQNIDLEIPTGQISVILGANGCGKSTLLKNMCKILRPTQGKVILDQKDIWKYNSKQLATKMGLMPQSAEVPEGITVFDLVSRGRFPYRQAFKSLNHEDIEAIQTAMEWMNITDIADKQVDELSGGQRQRVWMALVLAQDTDILFLDEPTTFLDIQYQIEILDCLYELNQKKQTTILMVLHDINLAARYSHHLFALKKGRLVAQGKPENILTSDLIKDVYGLECRIIEDPYYHCPMVLPIGKHKV